MLSENTHSNQRLKPISRINVLFLSRLPHVHVHLSISQSPYLIRMFPLGEDREEGESGMRGRAASPC